MSRTFFAFIVAMALFALSSAFTAAPSVALRSAAGQRCSPLRASAADEEKARREALAAAKPRAPTQNDYLSQFASKGPTKSKTGTDGKNTRIVRFP